MSTAVPKGAEPLHESDLTSLFREGIKPAEQFRIGTEYEKFVVDAETYCPIHYAGPNGIQALLEFLAAQHGWTPYIEEGHLVALQRNGESISLEPGGQLELSGAPLANLHETADELERHVRELHAFADPRGLAVLWAGAHPKAPTSAFDWMPKKRYSIMRKYLPTRGSLAHHMMQLTCTVQVNVDYSSERDAWLKTRLGMALTPLVTAAFANSPLLDGKPVGYRSYRQRVWLDVDDDRCGLLPFAFAERDGEGFFQDYADWAAAVPMFFIHRDGAYLDVSGTPFSTLLREGVQGHSAQTADWELHLSTLFPDARIKRYLEVRAADCVPPPFAMAVPALWIGVLYDTAAMDEAWSLVSDLSLAEREQARVDSARLGLASTLGGRKTGELLGELVEIAAGGLERRGQVGPNGMDESQFLEPLRESVRAGRDPATTWLDASLPEANCGAQ